MGARRSSVSPTVVEAHEPGGDDEHRAPGRRRPRSGTRPHATNAEHRGEHDQARRGPHGGALVPNRARALDKPDGRDSTSRRGARRRPARPHARARGHPARRSQFRFLDPVAGAPAAAVGRPGGRRARRRDRAGRGRRATRPSSPTSGRACRPTPARFLAARRAGAPGCAVARGGAGPAHREGDVPARSASARPRSPRSTTAPGSTRRSTRSAACPRCSRPGAAATTARASAVLRDADDVDARVGRAGRRAAASSRRWCPSTASCRCSRCAASTAGGLLAAGREPPRAAASSA